MIKYNEIRQDLLKHGTTGHNGTLNCHQFMMGKGKTSVFTPLLSFLIILLKHKQTTIITLEHLIKPTRKYTIFIENITDLVAIIGELNIDDIGSKLNLNTRNMNTKLDPIKEEDDL